MKKGPEGPYKYLIFFNILGGANQSRTGLTGFAIRGITALLSRQYHYQTTTALLQLLETGAGKRVRTVDLNLGKVALYQLSYSRKHSSNYPSPESNVHKAHSKLERENGFEPSTSTLARLRSTN
jgi:hypothetical protein